MRLNFAKEIYEIASIQAAAKAYAGLADVSVNDSGTYWTCALTDCRYGEELTTQEFENYVIDHMNGS